MLNKTRVPFRKTAAAALFGLAAAAAAEQPLPATQHQADLVESVERKEVTRTETQSRMPASEHQKAAIRQFEAADTNRDGHLTRDEYAAFIVSNTAERYSAGLSNPEAHGVDAAGPRDRHAAENTKRPLPSGDPTVTD